MEILGHILSYLKLCRPANVVLAGCTQWGVHYYLFKPFFSQVVLDGHLLLLFVVCLGFLVSGGFVINDIMDQASDKINKPSRPLSSARISARSAILFYIFILLSGMGIAFYVAWKVGNVPLVFFYFGWSFLLYAYSKWWKSTVLVGNIAVSLFIASVPAMVLFAEREAFAAMPAGQLKTMILELILMMMLISFMINLIREVAKDAEDQEGDNIAGYRTFVLKYGEKNTRVLMTWLTTITILICIFWMIFTSIPMKLQHVAMVVLFVTAPLGVAIQILTASTHKRQMSDLSALLRWVLLAGVVTCLSISQSMIEFNKTDPF